MAGKRRATSDLNHDNWEKEEEPEDAGTFQRASQDELNRRIIKTAKRRKPVLCEDSNKQNAFANFTALSKVSAPSPTAFSFLSKLSTNVTNEQIKEETNEPSKEETNEPSKEVTNEPPNEETKEGKKLLEHGKNEIDLCKKEISDNKLLEMSGDVGDEENSNHNNSREKVDTDNSITKDIIENSSPREDESSNSEISGDAEKRVEKSNNKTDELEELSNKKNIDSDTMVSRHIIVSVDKKADEALNDNSEKKDTNNS